MKLKRHKCKSIKEFNKIIRKYGKYLGIGKRFNKRFFKKNYNDFWYTWLWIDFLNPWDKSLIREANIRKLNGSSNLSEIIDEVQNNYGWTSKDGYKLLGIEITNEDYYYIYKNDNGDIKYYTCVGFFTDIDKF